MRTVIAQDIAFAHDASLSSAYKIPQGFRIHGILVPAGWDAADISIQANTDGGSTYYDVYVDGTDELVIAAGASKFIVLDPTFFEGLRYIKLRSGVTALPVAQTAADGITVQLILVSV